MGNHSDLFVQQVGVHRQAEDAPGRGLGFREIPFLVSQPPVSGLEVKGLGVIHGRGNALCPQGGLNVFPAVRK